MVAGLGRSDQSWVIVTGAALIAAHRVAMGCCGIERESANITAILPQAGELGRAALPHLPQQKTSCGRSRPEPIPAAIQRIGWHAKCFMTVG
jgi:hypothetical protein